MTTTDKKTKWKGPRNVPKNVKAQERRRIRKAQRITRKAYNGQ